MERSARAKCERQQRVASDAVNQFSLHLYRASASETGNIFFSPYSIHAAMSMAWNGAAGQTAAQMADVLHWPAELRGNGSSEDALVDSAGLTDTLRQLAVANAMWAQSGHPFHEAFVRQAGASFYELDFARAAEQSRQQINDWVARQTLNRIRDLVPAGSVNELTRLVLTNTIYFKADWRKKFDPDNTADASFHLADGSTLRVPMMHQTDNFSAFDEPRFVGIELHYARPGLSMQLFVPRRIGDLDWLEETILAAGPESWQRQMHRRHVDLSLPRFRLETSLGLGGTLRAMGMTAAFDPITADFSAMTPDSGYSISEVIHRAVVDVNEQGTEAAGATAAVLMTGCEVNNKPLRIKFDRPFVFTICGESMYCSSRTVLFMGRVMCPAAAPLGSPGRADGDELEYAAVLQGKVTEFLTVNKFRVRLRDGREIVAVMPDDYLELAREQNDRTDGSFITVELELREPPAIPRITSAKRQMPNDDVAEK